MLKSINTLQIERTMIRMEMKTEILPASDEKSIEKAAALLQNGELVALPTETVYGIAADARNGEAVKKIFVVAGFLNAFTANERAALLNTTITVGKSSTDGGGTETCTDKIFPLSCTEVGLSGDHVCGSKLAIFSDNNSRIATVTASCVANSNYSGNPGSGAAWYYWLRDAYAGSAGSARAPRLFQVKVGGTSFQVKVEEHS